VLARETAETLADHDPPVLAATIGQRIAFAAAAQSGRLVSELDDDTPAAREIAALADAIDASASGGDAMSERPARRGFASRPADPDQWIKAADRRRATIAPPASPPAHHRRDAGPARPDQDRRVPARRHRRRHAARSARARISPAEGEHP
jgi:hypothetical protein